MNNSSDGLNFRVEEDALGSVEVPVNHLWGAQTPVSYTHLDVYKRQPSAHDPNAIHEGAASLNRSVCRVRQKRVSNTILHNAVIVAQFLKRLSLIHI